MTTNFSLRAGEYLPVLVTITGLPLAKCASAVWLACDGLPPSIVLQKASGDGGITFDTTTGTDGNPATLCTFYIVAGDTSALGGVYPWEFWATDTYGNSIPIAEGKMTVNPSRLSAEP